MSDTLITIITITTILVLMFAVPMMFTANQNDEITESSIRAIVDEFVNKEATKGKITLEDYNTFVQALNATGNRYDIDMQVQIMGDNPGVKGSATTALNMVGENIRHTEYNDVIMSSLEGSGNQYLLNKGDYIIVNVKNSNITLGTQLQQLFYQVSGKGTAIIDTTSQAMVAVTGTK